MKLFATLAAVAVSALISTPASAALYTSNYGTLLTTVSDCDDCYEGPVSLGAGQTMAYFGETYGGVYVGSNGYVTFGSGSTEYNATRLTTQTVGKMIAGLYTDLDSRNDAASTVYVNSDTLGQLVITWSNMYHYNHMGVNNTFQLVLRSDQYVLPSGQGQIGFFYGAINDPAMVSAGFGDGLAAVNPGEVDFAYGVPGSSLSNSPVHWYSLANTVPAEVSEPGSLALLGAALVGVGAVRRKRATAV